MGVPPVSHHPFVDGMFHHKPSSYWVPEFMETSMFQSVSHYKQAWHCMACSWMIITRLCSDTSDTGLLDIFSVVAWF